MQLSEIAQLAVDEALKEKYIRQPPAAPPQLRFKGKPVDLSLPWRLSGIPNLGKLDLRLAEPKAAAGPPSKVRVSFQSPDGTANGAFLPSTSLYAALDALATVGSIDLDSHHPKVPVLSNGSVRVAGADLQAATFEQAFGITSGSAV